MISEWIQPQPENENELLDYVAHYGPTIVGIDASGRGFMEYESGIYDIPDDCSPQGINHGVSCVGLSQIHEPKI